MLARDADKAPDWRTSQVVMACQGQTTGGFKHPNRSQTKVDKLSTKKHRRGKWRDQRLLFSSSLVGLPFLVLLVSNCLSCFSAHKACLGSLERRCPVCLACVCVGPHLAQNPKRDVTCRKGPLSVCLHSGVPVPATV